MESHLASKDSQIVQQFVHRLGPTADYVQQRRMVKYFNSGGSTFNPNSVKVFRFDLTCSGQEMLDPLTTYLEFKVINDSYDGTADTAASRGTPTLQGQGAVDGSTDTAREESFPAL